VRVVFLGNDPWSVAPLEALAASAHPVELVVTRDPRPAGRGGSPRPTAVAEAARGMGLLVLETPTVRSGRGREALQAAASEVLVVVAYGEILPPEVLSLPAVAPVNVHFSMLPALRGADPVRRAILAGHERTGVTTLRMDEGLDTGPILLQAGEPILPDDDAGALGGRLAILGGRVLVETLDRLAAGDLEDRPQDHARATAAPKLSPQEEWMDWSADAEEVLRRIRALAPEPGARTRFRGSLLKVLRAGATDGSGDAGAILEASKDRLVVAAGRGALGLEEVIPEGRGRMTGAEFARGRRPQTGERFG
jgi:methionyl-tRNA formyltransferase